jgi:hypothetical protein
MSNPQHIKLGDILDLINEVQSLNEAIFMAAEHHSITKPATGALQAVSGELDSKLRVIEERIDEMMEAIDG